MPLFHFHLTTPTDIEFDQDGIELPDLDRAYLAACQAIPETVADLADGQHDPSLCAFHIADSAGMVLMVVPLLELVPHRDLPRPDPVPGPATRGNALLQRLDELSREVRSRADDLHHQVALARQETARFAQTAQGLSSIAAQGRVSVQKHHGHVHVTPWTRL